MIEDVIALTDSQLAGSGAAENHAPALIDKINEIAAKANELAAAANKSFQASVDVDLKDDGSTDYEVALGGDGTGAFVLDSMIVQCLTEDTLSGDADIKVGTTTDGAELIAATTQTGLDAVGDTIKTAAIATVLPALADDSTLHVTVDSADSGTSGTAKVILKGTYI